MPNNALKFAYLELDDRVQQRTEMLSQSNEQLLREIEERKIAEQALIDHQDRLRRLSTELLQTEERERRRIASEIHDRIGQTLAVTKIQLGALKAALESDKRVEMVEDVRQLITRTIKDTRTLTFELSPPVLYELGLQAALEWLAESVRKQTGLVVAVEKDGHAPSLEISRRVFLFQAVRELLFNVVKHARAEKAVIKISGDSSTISIHVIDDGRGEIRCKRRQGKIGKIRFWSVQHPGADPDLWRSARGDPATGRRNKSNDHHADRSVVGSIVNTLTNNLLKL